MEKCCAVFTTHFPQKNVWGINCETQGLNGIETARIKGFVSPGIKIRGLHVLMLWAAALVPLWGCSLLLVQTCTRTRRILGWDPKSGARRYPASPSVTFGVSCFAVFLGYSLCTKEEEFYCLQGRSEGLLRKMTLVFPCLLCMRPMNKCHFRTGTGRGSQGTPRCSRHTPTKNDTLKMTLGRARKIPKLFRYRVSKTFVGHRS